MSYFDDSETLQYHRKKWEGMHTLGAAFFILIVGGLGLGGFMLSSQPVGMFLSSTNTWILFSLGSTSLFTL